MPKATVVVPVYNVEKYLEKCVDSILAQTEPDFELLLVDDGSTDGSGRLCDKLAEKDGRVRVIHQKNQGLGGARNTGIQQAQGDWLLLVDSDDWIEPQTLEKTMEAGLREERVASYKPMWKTPPRTGASLWSNSRRCCLPLLPPASGCTAGSCWSARASSSRPGCGTRICAPRPSCWRKPARWCIWTMWATTI